MMKVQNKFLALCVAGLILATAASVLADTAGADAKSMYVMGVIAGENGKLQTADPFSTTDIYSLKTVVNYANVKPGVHVQQLKFISPEGALYQTVSTAFTGKRPRRGEPESVSVNGQDLRVQVIEARRNQTSVWGELPVAGTWIQRLKGTWKVEAYLDGGTEPVASMQFVVQ
jgi:hypothetical protein